MRHWVISAWTGVAAIASMAALSGCDRRDPNSLTGATPAVANCPVDNGPSSPGATPSVTSGGGSDTGAASGAGGSSASGGEAPAKTVLDERVLNYTEALRTASFKLVGNAPTLKQIGDVRDAPDPKKAYEAVIDELMTDKRFAARMVELWKNTMRMGGSALLDAAPTFAARLTVEGNQPYTDLFTADANTCPTFDPKTGTFTDGSCQNGTLPTAGILTDVGVHMQYYGSLALRRVRFFQEVFVCRKQPAELATPTTLEGGATYTSPWPFKSIAGYENGGRIDFLDATSSVCANCHSTSNHRLPLFAVFDMDGKYVEPVPMGQDTEFPVPVPIDGVPNAKLSDFLPAGEATAWKLGVPAATLKELGLAMAADEEVQSCAVVRMWNYAMSKGDVINDISSVPASVIAPLVDEFKQNNFNLRATIRAIFVHDDFVRF